MSITYYESGTRWRSWLRHCATIGWVAGSNPDVVIGSFHWLNFSVHVMPLGLTRPRTDTSTRGISWGVGKGGLCVQLTTLSFLCADCLEILGA